MVLAILQGTRFLLTKRGVVMDGIIVVNKEKGYTSHDVVAIVKKIAQEKVGHTGTLDPNATGVLPLLIGKATLISKYLVEHDKIYVATLQLGIKTTTADAEGAVIQKQTVPLLNKEKVEEVLHRFLGKQIQTPPVYSAIKVKGKKLYEYTRIGKEHIVEIPKREIEIYQITLQKIKQEQKELIFRVSCSKGTYIRSLCEDIANALGTVGYMKELTREKVGRFDLKESIKITELQNNPLELQNHLITIETLFANKEKIVLPTKKERLFLNGVKLEIKKPDGVYRIYHENGKWIGLGVVKQNELKRDVVIEE